MARIRTIKPEFWSDEKLSSCDAITRLVFLGLIGMSDDAGRLLDNVKVIDAFIFPSTSDTCRDALATLSRMCRIRRGTTVSGQSVIQICNWHRHQKVDKPNLSACFPEIYSANGDTEIRDALATDSRPIRDALASHTTDLRPTTTTTPKPPRENPVAGGGDSWNKEIEGKVRSDLAGCGFNRVEALIRECQLNNILPSAVLLACEQYRANKSRFNGPGAIAEYLRSGSWPATVVSTKEGEKRQAVKNGKKRAQQAESARVKLIKAKVNEARDWSDDRVISEAESRGMI